MEWGGYKNAGTFFFFCLVHCSYDYLLFVVVHAVIVQAHYKAAHQVSYSHIPTRWFATRLIVVATCVVVVLWQGSVVDALLGGNGSDLQFWYTYRWFLWYLLAITV